MESVTTDDYGGHSRVAFAALAQGNTGCAPRSQEDYSWRHEGSAMNTIPAPGRPVRERACGYCGQPVSHRGFQQALVADSSVIDPHDPSRDGHRVITACTAEHLQLLIDEARASWSEEQLWFGRLCRASRQPGLRDASLSRLGESAGLSPEHLRRALAWNATRPERHETLPGGQPLPSPRTSDHRAECGTEAGRRG